MIGGGATVERELNESKKDAAVWGPRMMVSTFGISQHALMMMSPHVRVHARLPKLRSRDRRRGEEDMEGLRAKLPREAARF